MLDRPSPFAALVRREAPWRDPVQVLSAFADEPHALAFVSGDWSYVCRAPERILRLRRDEAGDPLSTVKAWLGPATPRADDGPPFQGGAAGLLCYELGARLEPAPAAAANGWPDAEVGLYPQLLAFDGRARRAWAIGRGVDAAAAEARARAAEAWLASSSGPPPPAGPLASAFEAVEPAEVYAAAVAAVVERIAAGELFQANIARAWRARLRPGAGAFALFERLTGRSPAPFAGYLRLPGAAVVSNSPERFLRVDARGRAETRPIKGTRPRGGDDAADARLAAELSESAKDRAENLMIVDLMRNDLARACAPGSVTATELFRLESFANVHHLVSTVTGQLAAGRTALDLLRHAFPAGSVTGAPKVQAMRVIAGAEPPRGPYCGSLFWAGFDGALDSSVLIRTLACMETADGWTVEARGGAGVTAGSDPWEEAAEAEAKVAAIRDALLA